jgi:sn-glycerol 3-phosphate transport system substrate-binding protein
MLDEERAAVPRTWDELAELAKRLMRRRGGEVRWGYEVPISWWFWVAMLGQAGGRLVDSDGTPSLGGAAGEKALAFWQRLVHRDRTMRPPPGRDYNAWQVVNQDYLAERVACTWTSTAFLRYLEENARFPVVAAPLPRDVRASVPTGGTFFVVLRAVPRAEKEAAWAFLRWMCEPEQTIAWATRTGYLPVTEDAVAHLDATGYYRAHPNDRVAYDQLAAADAWPWAPNLFRIQRDVVEPRLEEAVLTNRDPRTVLDEARAEARRPA